MSSDRKVLVVNLAAGQNRPGTESRLRAELRPDPLLEILDTVERLHRIGQLGDDDGAHRVMHRTSVGVNALTENLMEARGEIRSPFGITGFNLPVIGKIGYENDRVS